MSGHNFADPHVALCCAVVRQAKLDYRGIGGRGKFAGKLWRDFIKAHDFGSRYTPEHVAEWVSDWWFENKPSRIWRKR